MKFITQYSHNDERSFNYGSDNFDETMTQQSDAADLDINVIMDKFQKTGHLPPAKIAPLYGDFTKVGDYRDALNAVEAAQDAFHEIPAKIRARFANNPQSFIAFATDPNNTQELRKLGLANPETLPDTPLATPLTTEIPQNG